MALVPHSLTVTVTTAGTAVKCLAASTGVVAAIIQPRTGTIYVGDSTVKASTPKGIKLVAADKDRMTIPVDSQNVLALDALFFDADADGRIVDVLYFTRV